MLMWNYILSAISLTGVYLVAKNYKFGWLIGACSGIGWVIYSVATKQYGMAVYSGILSVIQYRAWLAR